MSFVDYCSSAVWLQKVCFGDKVAVRRTLEFMLISASHSGINFQKYESALMLLSDDDISIKYEHQNRYLDRKKLPFIVALNTRGDI